MKKILLIHHSGMIGGAGVSLLHILESIDVGKNEVKIHLPKHPKDMYNKIFNMGFKISEEQYNVEIFRHYSGEELSFFNPKSIINYFRVLKSVKEIKRMLRNEKPDIVIINSMTLFYVGKIAQQLGIKTICFHRETYAKGLLGFRTKLIKKALNNNFDEVVFISEFDKNITGVGKSNKHVIYDKVKLEEITSDDRKLNLDYKREKYVLYMGGMSELKGAHIIVNAMKYVDDDVKLLFMQYAGPKKKMKLKEFDTLKGKLRYLLKKDYQANLLSEIDKHKLWDRILFFDKTFDTVPFLNSSNLVVFPSTLPHQARPIYEAGAKKIPVIITYSPNIAEFVHFGVNGLTFQNRNVEELAELINYILSEEDLREKLGKNNYEMTSKNHNFDKLKLELRNLI